MNVTRSDDGLTIEVTRDEAQLLRLSLKRATFEDTPADTLNDVLDFAVALQEALGAE